MVRKLLFTVESHADLDDAFQWYEQKQAGLGRRFLESVRARLDSVVQTPQMHQRIIRNYRRTLVRGFPYAIFYDFDDGAVTVYGIVHTSRADSAWRNRLD